MKQYLILGLLSTAIFMVKGLKVALFSDVHILPSYNAKANNTCFCTVECTGTQNLNPNVASSAFAPLGKLFCDPPQDLFEAMLQKLTFERPDLDILVVTGDIVGHTFSQDVKGNFSEKLYETLLQVHQNFSILAAKYLPNTVVLPTFGNNDFKYHYQTP